MPLLCMLRLLWQRPGQASAAVEEVGSRPAQQEAQHCNASCAQPAAARVAMQHRARSSSSGRGAALAPAPAARWHPQTGAQPLLPQSAAAPPAPPPAAAGCPPAAAPPRGAPRCRGGAGGRREAGGRAGGQHAGSVALARREVSSGQRLALLCVTLTGAHPLFSGAQKGLKRVSKGSPQVIILVSQLRQLAPSARKLRLQRRGRAQSAERAGRGRSTRAGVEG